MPIELDTIISKETILKMDKCYIYFEYFKPCFWKIIAKLVKAMWTKGIEYNSFEIYKEDIVI